MYDKQKWQPICRKTAKTTKKHKCKLLFGTKNMKIMKYVRHFYLHTFGQEIGGRLGGVAKAAGGGETGKQKSIGAKGKNVFH